MQNDMNRCSVTRSYACVSGVEFRDKSWEMFSGLRSLQDLNLQESNTTNETINSLQGLSNLQTLSLKQTEINDAGLPSLQNSLGSLTSLDISGNPIIGGPVRKQAWGMLILFHFDNLTPEVAFYWTCSHGHCAILLTCKGSAARDQSAAMQGNCIICTGSRRSTHGSQT